MKLFKNLALLGLMLSYCCTRQSPTVAKDAASNTAVFQKITIILFTVTPQALEGAPLRADQDAVLQRLAEEATTRAERLLLKRHVAATLERATSSSTSTPTPVLTGLVTLPISLPPGVIGWKARSRKGPFVTVKTKLVDAAGQVVAQEEVTLDWDGVRWLQGAKHRRNLPLDDVLKKFTRKSVDRATETLASAVLERRVLNQKP